MRNRGRVESLGAGLTRVTKCDSDRGAPGAGRGGAGPHSFRTRLTAARLRGQEAPGRRTASRGAGRGGRPPGKCVPRRAAPSVPRWFTSTTATMAAPRHATPRRVPASIFTWRRFRALSHFIRVICVVTGSARARGSGWSGCSAPGLGPQGHRYGRRQTTAALQAVGQPSASVLPLPLAAESTRGRVAEPRRLALSGSGPG